MLSTGLVVHYVKDYTLNSIEKTKTILSEYYNLDTLNPALSSIDQVSNFSKNLPIGTIICIDLSDSKTRFAHVCLPMLTTHISLPVKPGEIVWFFKNSGTNFNEVDKIISPMISINSFWLSKKVGTRISEDLSFTSISRDSLVKNFLQSNDNILDDADRVTTSDKKDVKLMQKEIEKLINLPDYEISQELINKHSFLSDISILDIYSDAKREKDFFPTAVPRWSSKPYELSLQGSNNSLVNLTKTFNIDKKYNSSGAIDIVAGRHLLEDFNDFSEESFFKIKDKIVQNEPDFDKRNIKELSINKDKSYIKIKNIHDDLEVLKNQEVYFGEEISEEVGFKEGFLSIENDASRLYVTEFDNLDNGYFYNSQYISTLSQVDVESQEKNIVFNTRKYLLDQKEIISKNYLSKTLEKNMTVSPGIFLKSNDIRIVARKKAQSKDLVIEEGSIRIIKESNEAYNSSHILLENDGKILVDGSIIQLGNFNKEAERHSVDTENEEDLKLMSGNGYGVLIGYDEKLSEPLVLGNTLEAILKEMLNINIQLLEELKVLTDDLQNHVHIGIPITTISGPPQVPTPYTNFSNTKYNEVKNRYQDIQNNLKDILSKFAKTS